MEHIYINLHFVGVRDALLRKVLESSCIFSYDFSFLYSCCFSVLREYIFYYKVKQCYTHYREQSYTEYIEPFQGHMGGMITVYSSWQRY